jgi:tRNA G18 (ribose-2'-O)-methylase SpoU
MRGYYGVGVLNMKTGINYGTLFRSAACFDADFIFLIGRRFEQQCSDTMKTQRHIPLLEYKDVDDFMDHRPYDCQLVGVEVVAGARNLVDIIHPERAIYILGPEDGSLPQRLLDACQMIVRIPTRYCLNVATAGSIVMYDRRAKNVSIAEVR